MNLTENERAWIEFWRICTEGRDPPIDLVRVQRLRRLVQRVVRFADAHTGHSTANG